MLMEEARMPQRKQLPSESEGLQKVPSIHALQIADHAFDPGVDQLVRGIETAAQQAREARRARELEPKEQREAGKREREQAAKQKRDRDRKRRLLTFAALALGAAVLIVGAALILPADGPELAEVHVGQQPVGVAVEEGKLWVTDREANMVWKINLSPDSEEVKKEYPVGERPDGVAVDSGGTVWVANGGGNAVSMLDPDNGYEDKPIDVGTSQGGIAVDSNNGSVWVALGGSDKVVRLNPDNGYEPESPIDVGDKPYGVTVGEDGSVWVTNRGGSGSVSWIPPDSEDAKTIHVGPNPKGIYATVDAVWVANTADGTVSKIDVASLDPEDDPSTLDPPAFPVGQLPRGVSVGLDSVWVSLGGDNQVARLDPESGDVEQKIDVGEGGEGPEGLVAGTRSVWVANGDDATVTRITP